MAMTGFVPETHGFAFINRWEFDEFERGKIRDLFNRAFSVASLIVLGPLHWITLSRLKKDIVQRINTSQVDPFGLCGGMAFAALDYYYAHRPAPRGDRVNNLPTSGTEGLRLRAYLWERLITSLIDNGARFVWWTFVAHQSTLAEPIVPNASDLLATFTAKQWTKLKKMLADDQPWPIGLIGGTAVPTLNHQVVACGYEEGQDGRITLYVYDMNCPGPRREIVFRFDGGKFVILHEECDSDARGPLRAFFCERFRRNPAPPSINWP